MEQKLVGSDGLVMSSLKASLPRISILGAMGTRVCGEQHYKEPVQEAS